MAQFFPTKATSRTPAPIQAQSIVVGKPSPLITLTTSQKVKLNVVFVDRGGKQANTESHAVWTSSKPEVANVAQGPDASTAIVTAVTAGGATISASTALRNGKILASVDVSVVGKDAVTGTIWAGSIEEQ